MQTNTNLNMTELPAIEALSTHYANGDLVMPACEKRFSYIWVTRAKRSQPWSAKAVCYVAGDICRARAESYFESKGFVSTDRSLAKLVNEATWLGFQTTQHFRSPKA